MASRMLVAFALFFSSAVATADWDEGDYTMMEDVFLPDLGSTGMAVHATDCTLAEDFVTARAGRVSGVHVWGAWLNDQLPNGSADNVFFTLGIHESVTISGPYGPEQKPGAVLWYRNVLRYTGGYQTAYFMVRPYATGLSTGWLTPNDGGFTPNAASVCHQYNFVILTDPPELEWDERYWLTVRAHPEDPNAQFGWTTSVEHLGGWSQWTWGGEPIDDPYSWVTTFYGGAVPLAFVITAHLPGDMNCDGVIDGFDIQPFVLALTDPDGYAAQYPDCDVMNADINADGVVDGFDIQPFVDLLVGG